MCYSLFIISTPDLYLGNTCFESSIKSRGLECVVLSVDIRHVYISVMMLMYRFSLILPNQSKVLYWGLAIMMRFPWILWDIHANILKLDVTAFVLFFLMCYTWSIFFFQYPVILHNLGSCRVLLVTYKPRSSY